MTYDLTTIGEGQLRLTAPADARLADVHALRVCAAGSEANVAGLLAQLGRRTAWASVIPAGSLGDRIVSEYRSAGVDTSFVRRPAYGRVATYFLEPNADGRAARVTYDRTGTPFRDARPSDFDWEALTDTRCLLVTGITAALTSATAELVRFAVDAAVAKGARVAVDINYRSSLWSPEAAAQVLDPLLASAWAVFCSRRDAHTVFGISGEGADVAAALRSRWSAEHVVSTDGARAVSYAGSAGAHHVDVEALPVVDRPGAGDALVAGTLHRLLDDDARSALATGIRAAGIALTHFGDLTRLDARDLDTHTGDDGGGIIR